MTRVWYWIFVSLITLQILGCADKIESKLDLDSTLEKKLKLSHSYKVVKLEKTQEALIKFVTKVQADTLCNRLFVLSGHNIFVYDLKGTYINKLKIGRGPDEVRRITAFTIDKELNTLYAIDDSRKICSFNYNGDMLETYEIKEYGCADICCLDNENVLLASNYVGGAEDKFVALYNLTSKKIVNKFIPEYTSDYPKMSLITNENFTKSNGKVHFQSSNIFGLFEYNDTSFNQVMGFNIVRNAMPEDFINKCRGIKSCNLRSKAKAEHYAAFMLYGFLYKGYYFVGIDDDDLNCFAINAETKEVFHNGPLSSYFGLPNKKSFNYLRGVNDGLVLFQCAPIHFFHKESTEVTKIIQIADQEIEINIEDNPFIVIVS